MPYTLMKGLGWFLLALLLGIVIGWLLRSIAATRQMRKLRVVRADHSELDRLRARNANLEPVVADRDRLVAELAARNAASSVPPIVQPIMHRPTRSTSRVAEAELEADIDADIEADTSVEVIPPVEPEFTELNLVAAASVIGRKVKLDDLTAIEGIGPAIAGLCNNIGIHTWADLAATEVSLLRTMLAEAGPRFKMHEPTSWPEQAGLLATGQWEAYTTLIASLGKRPRP